VDIHHVLPGHNGLTALAQRVMRSASFPSNSSSASRAIHSPSTGICIVKQTHHFRALEKACTTWIAIFLHLKMFRRIGSRTRSHSLTLESLLVSAPVQKHRPVMRMQRSLDRRGGNNKQKEVRPSGERGKVNPDEFQKPYVLKTGVCCRCRHRLFPQTSVTGYRMPSPYPPPFAS
jgi:hypothetical protein